LMSVVRLIGAKCSYPEISIKGVKEMRGGLSSTFIILVVCSLIFAAQFSLQAQTKNDQDSPRLMIQQLQSDIEEIRARIAENPSSPEAEKLKGKIQWNERKIKEILPGVTGEIQNRVKSRIEKPSGLELYMVIAKKNLFTPLGSGGQVKQQGFAVTGILGRTALIKVIGGSASYYVSEGESFGNGAKLIRIEENSVTITHEGREMELRLGNAVATGRPKRETAGESKRRQKSSPDDERMRVERQEEEMHRREMEEREHREHIERKIHDMHREREEVVRRIGEMEERGIVDHDAHRRAEELGHVIRDLESELR